MKTTLSVTILIILGLVLPQHPIALVIPFSSKGLDYASTTSQPDFLGPVSTNQQLQQKMKYQEDLQKILLFLTPRIIHQSVSPIAHTVPVRPQPAEQCINTGRVSEA